MVKVDGKEMEMFTPTSCDKETAMAIAVATFGSGITELVDEGHIRVALTNAQYGYHEEGCEVGA
jgi:hypothetical protein